MECIGPIIGLTIAGLIIWLIISEIIFELQFKPSRKKYSNDIPGMTIELFDEYIADKFKEEELDIWRQKVDDEMERIRARIKHKKR
jgi:hypothetical protein